MGVTESILRFQLKHGILDNEEQIVRGIAQLAVDKEFGSLTDRQRAVIEPFLTQHCSGFTDAGGYHNDCDQVLFGDDLLVAYELSEDTDSLECESCRSESGFQAHMWDRIKNE